MRCLDLRRDGFPGRLLPALVGRFTLDTGGGFKQELSGLSNGPRGSLRPFGGGDAKVDPSSLVEDLRESVGVGVDVRKLLLEE